MRRRNHGRSPMKVAHPPVAPVPDRKPDVPSAARGAGAGASFQAVLADAQKAGPLPGRKPAAPPPFETTDAGRIVQASRQVAGLSGHSLSAILAQATQESGLSVNAKNRASSAAGPFQFLERTWLDLFRRHGAAYGLGDLAKQIESRNGIPVVKDMAARKQILELRHDVDVAAGMAARYLGEGRERLAKRLKRPVTEAESRIAYIMGVGGAAKLIRTAEASPGAVAAQVLPGAAKANHNLFHDRGTGRALTARETVTRLVNRMENDQREMFAAIARAGEQQPIRLDGNGASPLGSFRVTGAPGAGDDGPLG